MENYTNYEIYWDDLTQKAQARMCKLYHENIGLTPIAFITLANIEFEDLEDLEDLDYGKEL